MLTVTSPVPQGTDLAPIIFIIIIADINSDIKVCCRVSSLTEDTKIIKIIE